MPPRRCSRYVGDGQPLDVAGARDRDDHVLLGDQVLELELLLGGDDLGAAVVAAAVDLLDLEQLLADDAVDLRLVAEDVAQLGDPLLQVGVLVLDLLARERRSARARRMSRIACAWISVSANRSISPVRASSVSAGGADQRDDRVDGVERDQVALEDVGAAPRPCAARTSSGG